MIFYFTGIRDTDSVQKGFSLRDKDRREREGKTEEEEVIIESETVTVYGAISQQVRWKSRTKVPSWLFV